MAMRKQGDSQLSFWPTSLYGQQCHSLCSGILEEESRFQGKVKCSDLTCLV